MSFLHRARSRNRWWYLLAGLATVAAGLASRRFPSFLPAGLGKYPGDVLWALMVFFGVGAWFRRAPTWRVAAGALAFSFAIEFFKLVQAPWLVELRHTTVGHLVLGHVFGWPNLAAYTAGILLGVLVEAAGLSRDEKPSGPRFPA